MQEHFHRNVLDYIHYTIRNIILIMQKVAQKCTTLAALCCPVVRVFHSKIYDDHDSDILRSIFAEPFTHDTRHTTHLSSLWLAGIGFLNYVDRELGK